MTSSTPVTIIGSGPAGLTAALYAARSNLKPVLIEGIEAGGQLMLTTMVENYPGYRDGIMGPDLMAETRAQAARFGAEIVQGNVSRVNLRTRPFEVVVEGRVLHPRALIIATGASARLLGLPSERALLGHGVSTCATCDGFFFRGRPIAVVGGGDSACEEAIFLTKFPSRRDPGAPARHPPCLEDHAAESDGESHHRFCGNSAVEEINDVSKGEVSGCAARPQDGARARAGGRRHFVAIGLHAQHEPFGSSELDPNGHIIMSAGSRTSVPGVFACGDAGSRLPAGGHGRRVGCMAAIDAERYLDGIPAEVGTDAAGMSTSAH